MNQTRASVTVMNPVTGLSVQMPVAMISAITILVGADLDVKGLNFQLADAMDWSDGGHIQTYATDYVDTSYVGITTALPNIAFGKSLYDAFLVLDAAPSLAVGKILDDGFVLSDVLTLEVQYQRIFNDNFVLLDSAQIDTGKALADSIVLSDSGAVHLQTYATDYVDTSYVGFASAF